VLRFARDCTQPYFNKAAAVVRAVVERPFALMKGPYDVARAAISAWSVTARIRNSSPRPTI